ncbi:LysR family transcriptional regulator [Arthrobacter sp. GMC3]|uniref:LysR family transcriptional regulator n=1 Tax=Arthrobacter sp. GMC3 TaxID=2058894 RepID=UPI000CE51A97|nr:LysR family transcriptional regulator [Arthrobacter sp. GMC3]
MFDAPVLRSFLAVEQAGGFTAAANELGLRQSTVSGHIAKLEKEVGRQLFLRDTHTVELTADGSAMLGFARSILESVENAQQYFAGGDLRGRLRFGASDDLVVSELPHILREFRQQHPKVELELTVGLSEILNEKLRNGRLDLVFGKRRVGETHGSLVWDDDLVWAGPPGGIAPESGPVPLVVYGPPSLTREAAITALADSGRGYRINCVTDSQLGLRTAVTAGLGFVVHSRSLLPEGMAEVAGLPAPGRIEFVLQHRLRLMSGPEEALTNAILANAYRLIRPGALG